jgi:rhamnogalacturonan endolyase
MKNKSIKSGLSLTTQKGHHQCPVHGTTTCRPFKSKLLRATLIIGIHLLGAFTLQAQRQMENIDRGLVAVRTSSNQVFISWRMTGPEYGSNAVYNLYRGSTLIASDLSTTNYVDNTSSGSIYSVSAVINNVEQGRSGAVSPWSTFYKTIPISAPPGGTTPTGESYTYTANDCSVGDLDGDGEYEIVLKWDPTNSKDNSKSGYTGNVYLDGLEMDGTRLWRINLGRNIRAGAHYTQFMVYDLDGDGYAEVACKTADGTRDGQGTVIGSSTADYRNSSGYILSGPEYLTVFNGTNGRAMSTVNYLPARGNVSDWGDSYGNRVDRFLACIAYLDGVHPSLVMCRGYYTRSVLVAWNFNNGSLNRRWTFDTDNGYSSYAGQGNHNLSVADVDNDGYDEIIYGSMCVDHNGSGLWNSGLHHGDAMHVSDIDPSRPGLEVWGIHEGTSTPGSALLDARTGQVLWQTANSDAGRGVSGDLSANFAGMECWGGTSDLRSAKNQSVGSKPSFSNFVIWWDGDVSREISDGDRINKWGSSGESRLLTLYNYESTTTNNSTKSTPCLQADLLGDWREEVLLRSSDNTRLVLFTTTNTTNVRMYTLMHDPVYRLGIAWQNVAYNQPPHTGFFFGNGMSAPPVPNITLVGGSTPEYYTLTTSVSGSGTVSPGSGTYAAGTCVNISASPTVGWVFSNWSGDIYSTAQTTQVCLNSNVSVTANFVTQSGQSDITLQENATGFCAVEGIIENEHTGYTGSGYANTDNATGTGIDYKIYVGTAGNYTFEIRYAATNDRPANLLQNGNAVASNIGLPSTGAWTTWNSVATTAYLTSGTNDLRLEATSSNGLPNIDYLRITGEDVSASDCNGATTTYSLMVDVTGNGSVNPSGGTYSEGEIVTLTATPDDGYVFSGWNGDVSGTSTPINITMNSNKNILAQFVRSGDNCESPVSVSVPFSFSGEGEHCWQVSDDIMYVNSWNLETLEVNGTDYTNTWSNTLPAKVDGHYSIYYKGLHSWSYFEISGTKSSSIAEHIPQMLRAYPNPAKDFTTISFFVPEEQHVDISLLNLSGKIIDHITDGTFKKGEHSIEYRSNSLETGIYILKLQNGTTVNTLKLFRLRGK